MSSSCNDVSYKLHNTISIFSLCRSLKVHGYLTVKTKRAWLITHFTKHLTRYQISFTASNTDSNCRRFHKKNKDKRCLNCLGCQVQRYVIIKELATNVYLGLGVAGIRINSCNVVDSRLELRATIPWRMTGCCGISMSTRPTDHSP